MAIFSTNKTLYIFLNNVKKYIALELGESQVIVEYIVFQKNILK